MINEQAIESLKNIKEYWTYKPTEIEVTDLAIQALGKQVPKKVVENYYEELDCGELYDKGYIYNCPNCDNEIGAKSLEFEEIFWQTHYCCDCGQKLDWS